MMKKTTLLFLLLMVSIGYAQTIPVTFATDIIVGAKDGVVTPSNANWFSDSGMSSVAVVDAPVDLAGHGKVGQINSSSTGAKWQNAQLLMSTNYIDLTTATGSKTISIDVYTTAPQDFLFKLEQSLNGGGNVEIPFSTNGLGWETIPVDFTSTGVNDQYKLLVLFPCYSAGFTAPAFDGTTYVDNISGVVGEAATPPSIFNLPITFETVPLTSDFNNFDGGTAKVINNPKQGTANNSAKVGEMVRNGGAAWAGTWLGLENNLNFSTLNAIKMDVWTMAPIGTTVALKVEGTGGVHKQELTTTTVTGAWETLSWDFTGQPADFYKLVLLFDLNIIGDGSATSTFYFDNIVQYNTSTASIKDFEIDGLMAYPNPTNGEWKISTNNQEIEAINIFNVIGTKVISLNPNATSVNVDASSLTSGVYLATITTAQGTSSRKLIKN